MRATKVKRAGPAAKSDPARSARKWQPAPEVWVRAFSAAAAGLGEARKMFGYPCAFVNGNMFAGLFETGMVLRLPEAEREAFLRLKGAARFEPMPGRIMREYVVAPVELAEQPERLKAWLDKAFAFGSSLPAKTRKTKPDRRSRG